MQAELPTSLPASFTYAQARAAGLTKYRLYQLRDQQAIEPVGRGVYRRASSAAESDPDLVELAHRAPGGTLCLATALARHELIDVIPDRLDVALPRTRRPPAAVRAPVQWHRFDPVRLDIGRETITVDDGTTFGLYGAERSVIDMFRRRHQQGPDLAYEALRRWLRQRGNQPSTLLALAKKWWPRSAPALRRTIEVMR